MFKYELHLHTSECSKCAHSTIEEMIYECRQKGYTGAVITNHFYRGGTSVDRKLPWNEFIEVYEKNWEIGKKLGDKLDFDVIFGIEECYLPKIAKECLIYGITPFELKSEPEFKNFTIEQIAKFVRARNGFLAAAHPFRVGPYNPEPTFIPDHRFFDGVEINASHENRNEMAFDFAKKHKLKLISGTDLHNASHPESGQGGIAVEHRIKDTKQLASVLHSGDYRLILNGEIRQN